MIEMTDMGSHHVLAMLSQSGCLQARIHLGHWCFFSLCPTEDLCLLQVPVNFHIGNIGLAQDTDATQDSVPPFESGQNQLSLASKPRHSDP